MSPPRRQRRTLTLVMLVLASLTIITLDLSGKTHHFTQSLKSEATGVFSPLRAGVNDVLKPVGDLFAGAVHYGSLQQENEKLQATLGNIRMHAAEQQFENRQLQEVMAIQNLPYLASIQTVDAQTIAITPSNFTETITLDKGLADGVDYGDAVVGAGGLIGQVVVAYNQSCVVRLITDGLSTIGVTMGKGVLASVTGQGVGKSLNADFVPLGTKLVKGEKMFTNGLAGAQFPPGIPVASISSFHTVPGATQISVKATPLANLNQLTYVAVVLWAPPP